MVFDNLRGIQKERDVKERAASALEKLLEVEKQVHKEYASKVSNNWPKDHDNIYLPLYQSLSSTLPEYTEQDIQSLLLTKSNNNYNDHEAQVLGMYTGVLLHVLTERLEEEGKKARFTFDLLGNEFDYLFYFAKRAGELMVKRVKGKYTCAGIASFGGNAEKVMLEGNEGDYAASWAGSNGGNVGTLAINGNKGDWAASRAGSNSGNVGTLAINGNKGDWAALGAGINKGNVGTLALYKAGRNAGSYAGANRIIKEREALKLYKRLEKELPCLKT